MSEATLLQSFNLLATAPGGVARLRELILTLAVQGKLVPQDQKDEPAIELLKKIRTEKDRLIAEGRIKRDKPQKSISASDVPFALPVGWEWVRLGGLLPYRIGKTPPSKDPQFWSKAGQAWVSISDMTHFGEVRETERKITPKGAALFGYEPLPVGTLIMSFKLTIGKIAVLRVPAYHNEAIASFLPLAGLNSDFLKFILPTVSRTGSSKNALMGQTLNSESLSDLIIALPPIEEQARITARVEELMKLCDALEEKGRLADEQHTRLTSTLFDALANSESAHALAENWKLVAEHFDLLLDRPEAVDTLEQTILQLAVRGLLVPQDPNDEPASELLKKICSEKDRLIAAGKIKRDKALSEVLEGDHLFELPHGWEWMRLGEVVLISSGVTLGRKNSIPSPVSLPYLRVANVQRWYLNLASMKEVVIDKSELERFQLENGDLLITEGGDWDKVGRTAIWRDELPMCMHQNHVFKARGISPDWSPNWAEMYLNSRTARAYFATSAKQTTNLASINMTQLKDCLFPLPPLNEQSRIVARVALLRSLCADLRRRLSAASEQKTKLAQALVDQ